MAIAANITFFAEGGGGERKGRGNSIIGSGGEKGKGGRKHKIGGLAKARQTSCVLCNVQYSIALLHDVVGTYRAPPHELKSEIKLIKLTF